jgi:hypothetical protein
MKEYNLKRHKSFEEPHPTHSTVRHLKIKSVTKSCQSGSGILVRISFQQGKTMATSLHVTLILARKKKSLTDSEIK